MPVDAARAWPPAVQLMRFLDLVRIWCVLGEGDLNGVCVCFFHSLLRVRVVLVDGVCISICVCICVSVPCVWI